MKVHLRFGMHRDVKLIHDEKDRIDGLVVPAHILAHQSASTSVFVTSLAEKPYIIDPMTFVFQNAKEAHLNDVGGMRSSIEKLCGAYHDKLAERIMTLGPDGFMAPDVFSESDEFCEKVAGFQAEQVGKASAMSGASKYLKRYGTTQVTAPRAVIPPYFRFSSVGDEWYPLSLTCATLTRQMGGDIEVAPVICCATSALNDTDIKTIVGDYAEFGRVFLWIDGYVQTSVTSSNITRVRSLIKGLSAAGVESEALYGGYLLIMSFLDGMSALSHGILYTQHKSTDLVPGSGGAPERYYIPAIHEFRSLSQTDQIIHQHQELICDCPVCEEVLGGDPDKIILFGDDPDLLRRHFLHCRRREADGITTSSPEAEAKRLRQVFKKYHDSFRTLPNPDAFVSSSKMQGLEYLNEWADAFEGS
ncbi:MAG: hypothetical protein JSU63_01140 [Phycisphaerales bacterium]|nr:MAG: hypothetical protein JSU63_01140 [Phycisphaerales bacterium]